MPKTEMIKASFNCQNICTEAIDAFFRMSCHGRWYFNMKKGFKGDEPSENQHRCRDLYATVNSDDRALLHYGFGRNLAKCFLQALENEFEWDAEARQEAAQMLPCLLRLL